METPLVRSEPPPLVSKTSSSSFRLSSIIIIILAIATLRRKRNRNNSVAYLNDCLQLVLDGNWHVFLREGSGGQTQWQRPGRHRRRELRAAEDPAPGAGAGTKSGGGSRCFRSRRVSRWDRSDDRSGGRIERIGGVDAQDADSNGALEACAADFGAIGTVRATLLSALFVIGTPQSGCGSGKGLDAPGACSQLANETFTAFRGPGRIGRAARLRAFSQHATCRRRKSGAGSGEGSTHKGLTPAAQTSPSQQTSGLVGSVAPHSCERSPSTPQERVGLAVGKGSTHLGLAPTRKRDLHSIPWAW